MTFWEHFLRVLTRKPAPALAALYWHVTRRRVRARNRLRVASADLPFAYAVWIANNERPDAIRRELDTITATWAWTPRFSVQVHSLEDATDRDVRRSIESVEGQIYPNWQLLDPSPRPAAAPPRGAEGDYFLPLRAGDRLPETALFRLAESLQTDPQASVLYGDQDQIDDHGRRTRPWFKPGWNEELFLAQDYLSPAVAINTNLAATFAAESGGDFSALLLSVTSRSKSIIHVPHIVLHVGSPRAEPRKLDVIRRRVESSGATCAAGPFGSVKVEWPLPTELPLVSMVIPTKDKLDVLRPCVESLLNRTEYPNFEMLIVDNGSIEAATKEFLNELGKDRRVRVIKYDRPFNYSAINNFAVRHTRGTFLCLLNNDTEVIEPKWLTELMRYAVRSEIGAVGAKLLYEDGSIQHAGVVVGIGDAAGHAHRFLRAGDPGYFFMPHLPQFVSAVTGACLLVDKSKFEAMGGFDEENLAVAFNDVDLCLKLQAAGWKNVYVPHAVLVHHESKSRASDMAPSQFQRYQAELAVLQDRWGTKTYQDPLHNPNLDRYSETYVFRL